MIRKSILITGVLFATISFGQTTIQMNLKGKVKSIQEVHEKCPAIVLAGSPVTCRMKCFIILIRKVLF